MVLPNSATLRKGGETRVRRERREAVELRSKGFMESGPLFAADDVTIHASVLVTGWRAYSNRCCESFTMAPLVFAALSQLYIV